MLGASRRPNSSGIVRRTSQLARLMEVAVRVERLALGESADAAETDPTRINADELRELLRAEDLLDSSPDPSSGIDRQDGSSNDAAIHDWLYGEESPHP